MVNVVSVDFGSVEPMTTATVLVEIENVGDAELTITAVTVSGPEGVFTVATAAPLTLAPGAKATIAVAMTPTGAGPVAGTLAFASNDPDGDVVVPVTGAGSGSEITSGGARAPPSLSDEGALVADLGDDEAHEVSISSNGSDLVLSINGSATTWTASSVTSITIVGADDYDDTLTVDFNGGPIGASISYDGGADGWDTLVVHGGPGSAVASTAYGPHDGVITVDGLAITYSNLEPTTMSGATVTVTGSSVPSENLSMTFDGTNVVVSGEFLGIPTMETVTVILSGLNTLTIDGDDGRDILTISGMINLGATDLIALAEVIILNGSLTTTGDVTLTAADSVSGGLSSGILGCLVPLLNGEAPNLGTHCAEASVTIDGSISAASVSITATSTVAPDSEVLVVPNSNAEITVESGSSISANTGAVLIEAVSQLTAALDEDTIAGLFALSSASVTADGATIEAATTLRLASRSTVDNGSGGIADLKVEGDSSSSDSSADAALATLLVWSHAATTVSGASNLNAGGAVTIEADNAVRVKLTADTKDAASGAGIALSFILPTTEAIVDGNGSINGASITIAADSDHQVETVAKAGAGGAEENADSSKNPDNRTKKPDKDSPTTADGNAKTGESGSSSLPVAAALAFTWLEAITQAYASAASGDLALTTTGGGTPQKIHAGGRNRMTTTADASAVGENSSGGVGVAIAVGLADVSNLAYLGGGVTLSGAKLAVESIPSGADDYKVSAKSGAGDKNSSDLTFAGALAVSLVDKTSSAMVAEDADVSAGGADLRSEATANTVSDAKAEASVNGSDEATGVGASVVFHIVFDATTAAIGEDSSVSGADDVELVATTTHTVTTKVKTGAAGGTAISAGAATSFSTATTRVAVESGSADLVIDGALTGTATQTASVTTVAEGAATGPDLAVGAALALTIATHEVQAMLERDVTADGAITMHAIGSSTTESTSTASAKGGKKESESGGKDVNGQADGNLDQANSKKDSGKSETPKAATGESGGDSVTVAAAISINIATSNTVAAISDDVNIVAGGLLDLTARGDTDAKAKADASAAEGSTGVGAAVAINFAEITVEAEVGAGVDVDSEGLTLAALMRAAPSDSTHRMTAEAKSGAAAEDIGVAGALAINIVELRHDAVIRGNPTRGPPFADIDVGSGDVSITAVANEADIAKAEAEAEGSDVGVGASIALNILVPTRVGAEVEDDATLTNADDVTVSATYDRDVNTTVKAGSEGDVSVTPAVAFVLINDEVVEARLGTDGTALNATGTVTVHADHDTDVSETTADAEAAGSSAAVGADVAINIVVGWSTTAEIARDIDAEGAITVEAISRVESKAEAEASAKGTSDSDDSADDKTESRSTTTRTRAARASAARRPEARTTSAGEGNSQAGGESGSSGGGVGVAAAIAVNWVVTDNRASDRRERRT